MQFYRDGFHPGDPAVQPAASDPAFHRETAVAAGDPAFPHETTRPAGEPAVQPATAAPTRDGSDVDVLIVGTGPAGLVLAAQLARFPQLRTRVVERRTGPLTLGQADGVACRTIEMFQAFGFAHTLLNEAYWVNETVFWRPDPDDRSRIIRTGRVQDVEDGLSEMPHVIMNQARIHEYLLQAMRNAPTRLEPDYAREFVSLEREGDGPVRVTLRDPATGAEEIVRARYVVGCDGARSGVRESIGRTLSGDRANHAWGVMDILANTDFPDLRFKAAIQSAGEGSILLIPREGGYLVRLYVDLGTVTEDNRATIRSMTAEQVADVARRVLHPYTLDVRETVWFSVYEVAQRIADGFDDAAGRGVEPRVFIAGDACHTHSAKAGQGMNVSMQDAFNLGWKLAAVLTGRAEASLLSTYDAERRPIAQELIDFDREWSAMLAAPPKDPGHPERGGVDPAEVAEYFVRQGRYTAGVATHYTPSLLTGGSEHQDLAAGFRVGMRFHSAPVVRVGDGKRVELGHAHVADGRWRLYVFADAAGDRFEALCEWLRADPSSPLVRFARPGDDIDETVDVRGVLQRTLHDTEITRVPPLLRPATGRLGLVDREKAFVPDLKTGPDIFDLRGVDREYGAMVLVRPDQYVAQVLPLGGTQALADYFANVLAEPAPVTA